MFIFYDILFVLFAILYLPYTVIRGKWHTGYKVRFGLIPRSTVDQLKGKRCIWIHAVSVGEIMAVTDLVKQIKQSYPQYTIVLTTVTKTGYAIAQEQLMADCIILFAPLDFSWVVRKFISVIGPKIYIAAETEIWPNLYKALHKRSIPIIEINGRISDSSYRGYKRMKFLTKRVLSCVDLFYMQSELDAQRIKELGAQEASVIVAGNLKFDGVTEFTDIRKQDIGFDEHDCLMVAGSTHPGEEEILIDVYEKLAKEFLNLRLVIAPRHIERTNDLIDLVQAHGFHAAKYSQIKKSELIPKTIIIVDTIGHLRELYSLARLVFVGKSLAVGGGQNMIESASFGKPTIVGPMTQNFKDAVNIFLKSDALIQVNNSQELFDTAQELLTNPEEGERIGKAARETVRKYQGATSRTIDAIGGLLER